MSNTSNYIQATECLQHISVNNQKIKIEDYFLSNPTQVDRQRHIDLTTECIPYRLKNNSEFRKKGDIASSERSMSIARQNLLEYFNIDENFNNVNIHTCHKCEHNSTNKEFVCINPLHLYIGTGSENAYDVDSEIKKRRSIKAGQIGGPKGAASGIAAGTNNMLQKVQCPHSSHITTLFWIEKYIKNHFPHLKQWDEYTKDEQKSFYR